MVSDTAAPLPGVTVDASATLPVDSSWWSRNEYLVKRLGLLAAVLALAVPLLQGSPAEPEAPTPFLGATGIPVDSLKDPVLDGTTKLDRRQTSPTDVCFRWAHMTAIVNGTLYIYGGQAAPNREQSENTWNNDFLTLDLTTSWPITSPPLTGQPQPSGPPAVACGTLWHSYDSLYLYGGEYSSYPPVIPDPFSLWEYSIKSSQWLQHQNPQTSAGQFSLGAGQPVGRAAEGAGISVPMLGRAWYFGGHQDGYTTPGWSQSIWRIYLTSLLEYTFPGWSNDQVTTLSNSAKAGADGAWRNITEGGLQTTNGFPERADGILLYIPGYGAQGILVGLAGGTNDTFQQMSQVDVFDIATSIWYKQATTGPTPTIRVNPCAVVASAPDGSSQNIYMFGGQNLQPAGNQTQFDDMWILTLPSFTWIQVDQSSQSVPAARAGHSCNVWNGQMVVVGGYVDPILSCDSPGVYIYDMSNLEWVTIYDNLADKSPDASIHANPFNQQIAQRASSGSSSPGLEGSFGYSVPAVVQSVVGGGSQGGATVTQPAQVPTEGPMKTGRPVTYTLTTTASGLSTTGAVTSGGSPSNSTSNTQDMKTHNTGAIVAGVVAGVVAVIALYLAYCAWLYRRRLATHKRNVDRARHLSNSEDVPFAQAMYFSRPHDDVARTTYGGRDGSKDMDEGSAFIQTVAAGTAHDSSGGSSQKKRSSGEDEGSTSGGSGGASTRRTHQPRPKSVDELGAVEPSFWGTMMSPRSNLRVTNWD